MQWSVPAGKLVVDSEPAIAGAASDRRHVMPSDQSSPPPATYPLWHELATPARAVFVCALPVAIGLAFWEAVDRSLGPEHPLSLGRLGLRLASLSASAVLIAIASTGTFRARRGTARLRKGLCPACGYDRRAHRLDD